MLLCQVYKSPRKVEMYLYVEKVEGLERVPASLLLQFGEPEPIMLLKLEPGHKLARVDVKLVLAALEEQGYFLQMPPSTADLLKRHHGEP